MSKVSIVIPSRNEMFLAKTVDDIFTKARGDFEVIVVLDEKDQELTLRPKLTILKKVGKPGMKSALIQAIKASTGEYIMKSDAHCMFGESFDTILSSECNDDWIVVPRRYSLEPSNWSIRDFRPIVDYEYIPFPYVADLLSVKTGGKWHSRRDERKDILIDENMTFQGSVWFLKKKYFWELGGFEPTSTGDDFLLESEEITNKSWLSGGKVMTNKKTWYAHLHKGSEYGRGYFMDKRPMKRQRIHHIDFWWHNKWSKAIHKMEWLIEHFWSVPSYPDDWKDPKYEQKWRQVNGLEPMAV
jgi:glycosyltransferase involved in cell wall biosynthesis